MARVVCQVLVKPERLTFLWSDGTASFAPYHLTGAAAQAFHDLASLVDDSLRDLTDPGASQPPGETALKLARLGHDLYEALFQPDAGQQDAAREVQGWLAQLAGAGSLEALEFLGDGTAGVPWGLLTDSAPDQPSWIGRAH